MLVCRDLDARPIQRLSARRSVVAIGNFDGLHLGHQALLAAVRELAAEQHAAGLVTFEPLPQALFRPEAAPARLTSPADKLRLLRESGLDLVWMMRFNRQLASLSPESFVQRVLVDGLSVTAVVVGEDFRFGAGRAGDIETLRTLGRQHDFQVQVVAPVLAGEQRIASSAIRQALAEGNMAQAEAWLGRPFSMSGRVRRGQQLGRKLGYPTANLRVSNQPCPVHGIFAVRCNIEGLEGHFPGVASVGYRPTVGGEELLLEVHLFEFEANLYHRHMEVAFLAHLRDEEHFPSLELLVAQMQRDEDAARAVLARH